MKVLLTGAHGQLGRCLLDRVPSDWHMVAKSSQELDITDNPVVFDTISQGNFDLIINAAAYTAVDQAETDTAQAFAVNATAVGYLAQAAENAGARLIHVSTDYVFDGTATTPYQTTDVPNPQTVYGKSKLAGELLALAHCSRTSIIRTAWVYSEYGHNFVKSMLRLGKEHERLTIVADQQGCPTYAGDLADFIIAQVGSPTMTPLMHFSGPQVMTWHAFAQQIFDIAGGDYRHIDVQPISSDDYPTAAVRPAYSVLENILDRVSITQNQKAALDTVVNRLQ